MKRILLLLIIVVAFSLRFYQLGSNPPALDWDEVSLGYNAYSLLKTGNDEYGMRLPTVLTSFGDYKPALYAYAAIPIILITNLSDLGVRLPSALIGVLTIFAVYGLIKRLFYQSSYHTRLALLVSLFMSISPWHIQFSRVAFEANMGLFWLIIGAWLFLLALRKRPFFLLALGAIICSLYSYHSLRLIVPLFFFVLILRLKKRVIQFDRWLFLTIFMGLILIFPLIQVMVNPEGLQRFSAVTLFRQTEGLGNEIEFQQDDLRRNDVLGYILHNRRVGYVKAVMAGYLDHFNPSFLFLTGDQYERHEAADMGLLYFWDAFFILLGMLVFLALGGFPRFFILTWFFLAPLASSLTMGTPHAVRALYFLPTYQVFTALGLLSVLHFFKKKGKMKFIVMFGAMIFLVLNIIYYLNLYFIHTPLEKSQYWQYGYKNVVDDVMKISNNYQKIVITTAYDQPYIYFLFYGQIDPEWYQKNASHVVSRDERNFSKFDFRPIQWTTDRTLQKTLFVLSPQDFQRITADVVRPIKTIRFLDGSVAFYLVER